jgi:hypothetical protein
MIDLMKELVEGLSEQQQSGLYSTIATARTKASITLDPVSYYQNTLRQLLIARYEQRNRLQNLVKDAWGLGFITDLGTLTLEQEASVYATLAKIKGVADRHGDPHFVYCREIAQVTALQYRELNEFQKLLNASWADQ